MKAHLGTYLSEGAPIAVVLHKKDGRGPAPTEFDKFFTITTERPEYQPVIKERVLPTAA